MGLAEDMNRLRSEIEAQRYERQARMQEIRGEVGQLKGDVGSMLQGFRQALETMAEDGKSRRQESIQEIVNSVSGIRRDSVARIAAFREQLQQMSQASAQERRLFVEAAGDYFARLKNDVAVMQEAFHAERMTNAANDRAQRQADMQRIGGAVDELLQHTHDMRMQFRNELDAARAAWQDLHNFDLDAYVAERASQQAQQPKPTTTTTAQPTTSASTPAPASQASQPAAAPAPKPEPTPAPRRVATPSEPDDLTQIVGIGPSTSQVLANAGIVSFAQLATSTPEDLNGVLGELARFANVKHWIKQANELLS
jgi:predicted flap endonuclease-1-like 5' DNA nuclease